MIRAQAQRMRFPKSESLPARCFTAYQEGMLVLHKIRNKGRQCIQVQYVQVSRGSQAIIENVG